jgi:hypothetical protein
MNEQLLIRRIGMNHPFWVIGIVRLVLAANPLRGQEIIPAAALPRRPSAAVSANQDVGSVGLGNPVDSGHYRHDLPCAPVETCNSRLNLSEKLRFFADHSFGLGAFIGALFTAGPGDCEPTGALSKAMAA